MNENVNFSVANTRGQVQFIWQFFGYGCWPAPSIQLSKNVDGIFEFFLDSRCTYVLYVQYVDANNVKSRIWIRSKKLFVS